MSLAFILYMKLCSIMSVPAFFNMMSVMTYRGVELQIQSFPTSSTWYQLYHLPLSWIQLQCSSHGIYGGRSGTGTGFSFYLFLFTFHGSFGVNSMLDIGIVNIYVNVTLSWCVCYSEHLSWHRNREFNTSQTIPH